MTALQARHHVLQHCREPLIVSVPRNEPPSAPFFTTTIEPILTLLFVLCRSIPTFLFPVFASYKALKTSDPALLTPWLMYWVVLACALFVESWLGFILFW